MADGASEVEETRTGRPLDAAGAAGRPADLLRQRALLRGRRARRFRIVSRSVGVGIVATVVDLSALALLIQGFGVSPQVANVPALLLGVVVQYLGNKYVAFEDHSRDHVRQGGLFALVETGTLLLNALGFHGLVTFTVVPYYLARPLVACAVYLGYSLPLWSRIFRRRAHRATAGPGDKSPAPPA